MDIGGSNGGSAALPTLKGCCREITLLFLINIQSNEYGTQCKGMNT